jgi:hypothetical protein
MLALACLAEQRFLEGHFSPHLNATMFRLVGQGIVVNSDRMGLFYPRRGGGLSISGVRFKDVVFQRPQQVEGTRCTAIGVRLAKALDQACRANDPTLKPIASSLEFFLLGHAEEPGLGWDSCIMLSAMAFEHLLECTPTAQGVAQAFGQLWAPFTSVTINQAKHVKPDPKYAKEQGAWPLHRKWIKELYEARSAKVHHGPRSDFTSNWKQWQHLILAGFAYPLTVKLMLTAAGFYQLSDQENGACEALDQLLDSNWGKGWHKPPEWSSILSISENLRSVSRVMYDTSNKVKSRP